MRTVLVYLLALGAVAAAVVLGFPDWLQGVTAAEAPKRAAPSRAATPVVVAEVALQPFIDSLEALGTVLANESVEITANRSDHIQALHFSDGERVEAGQLLVEMNSAEESARLQEAAALRDELRVRHEQTVELHKKEMRSQRDLDNVTALLAAAEARVIALEAAISDLEVRAPFAGTLGFRRVSSGAFIDSSTVITTLDDLSVVKLDFTIPETWLPAVEAGMAIRATSVAWVGDEFSGEVTNLETRLDPQTRSATVRARIPNPDGKLRPGMLLKVAIERGERPVLQVPESALIPIGEEHFVMRVDGDSVVHRDTVRIGRRRVGAVEILDGLEAGHRVVVEGLVRVRPGSNVDVVKVR